MILKYSNGGVSLRQSSGTTRTLRTNIKSAGNSKNSSTRFVFKWIKTVFIFYLNVIIFTSFPPGTFGLEDVVCGGFDMRNSPSLFLYQHYTTQEQIDAWKNCTVIEGDVRYILMEREHHEGAALTADDFKEVTLPKVREITGSLMIFQVVGLDSVATLLPNLRIIRGNSLFQNYALVLFQNPDLKEIGLGKFLEISNGGVRISTNPQLCYASTLNFTEVCRDKQAHIVVDGNQDPNNCGDQCKQHSLSCMSRTSRQDASLIFNCWDHEHCQMACPKHCVAQNRSCNLDESPSTCCHEECAGGCSGPTDRDCYACRHVNFGGRCMRSCPNGLYMLKNRRCISAEECLDKKPIRDELDERAYFKPLPDGTCQTKCPSNYNVDPNDPKKCIPCVDKQDCIKKCNGGTITSFAEAEHYRGCTVVAGFLEISIQSDVTKNLAQKLEESLGEIREIEGYLKISFSPSLVSLNMFKNLRAIRGLRKKADENVNKYALSIFENQNLAQLWNFTNGLIINGSIQFHYNPQLCYNKIKDLASVIGIKEIDSRDVSEFTNGNKAVCDVVELSLKVIEVGAEWVVFGWDEFMPHLMDHRMFLGYQLYRRKVDSENVDIFEGRDACRDSWQMTFVPSNKGAMVTELKPNTLYAFYLSTLIVNSPGAKGGMSKVVYQRTKFTWPSQPRVTKLRSQSPNSITIDWESPLNPNGDITHYMISYVKRRDILPSERDYCRHKPTFVHDMDDSNGADGHSYLTTGGAQTSHSLASKVFGGSSADPQCCQCDAGENPSGGKMLPDVQKQLENAAFENAIQNVILPTGWRRKKRSIDGTVLGDEETAEDDSKMSTNESDTIAQPPQPVLVNVTGLNFTISNLYHFTSYEIRIWACQNISVAENFCSSQEVLKTHRTQPIAWKDDVNGSSIRLANTSEPGTHSISVQWDQPEDPNGLILGYEVQYSKMGGVGYDATNQCVPISAYLKQNGYTFTDLAIGRYQVRVRCMSLAQWGEWSSYFYFDIVEPYKVPNTVIILIAVGTSVSIVAMLAVFAMYIYKRNFRKKLPEYLFNVFSANPEYISQLEVYKPDEWELKREDIELRHEIGRGTFGTVYAGMGKNATSVCGVVFGECAVKTVSERASIYDRWHFLIEASVMKQFNVAHIVKLYGVVSEGQPALVVMEMMHKGNLRDYLRSRRPNAEENVDGLSPPTMKETLQWAGEIADGMAYLEALKFCHRDLAARNCMVSAENICKIGDFGMARDVYVKDYYRPTGKRLMPVRWMAPEALKDATFTSKSDIWSYGVVLWEMATLASQPYAGLSNEDVMRYVVDHQRVMEMPTGCPLRLYDLMCLCWKYERKDRPTFADILALILPEMNERFRRASYYCTQRHLKELVSRSSKKDRHSSQAGSSGGQDVEQQSCSEAALIITPDAESSDEKCFELATTATTTTTMNSIASHNGPVDPPLCQNNRISPSHEKTKRTQQQNFTNNNYPVFSETLLDADFDQQQNEIIDENNVIVLSSRQHHHHQRTPPQTKRASDRTQAADKTHLLNGSTAVST